MQAFSITEATDERITVAGDLDVDGAGVLRTALAGHDGRAIELDLAGLTFIDSRGLSALLRLRHANPAITLVNPTSEARRLFELTGTTRLLLGDLAS